MGRAFSALASFTWTPRPLAQADMGRAFSPKTGEPTTIRRIGPRVMDVFIAKAKALAYLEALKPWLPWKQRKLRG